MDDVHSHHARRAKRQGGSSCQTRDQNRCPSLSLRFNAASFWCRTDFDPARLAGRLAELEALLADPQFWIDPNLTLMREHGELRCRLGEFVALLDDLNEVVGLDALGEDVHELVPDIGGRFVALEHALMFPDPSADVTALVTVSAGAGGAESCFWVQRLANAYRRFSAAMNWSCMENDWAPASGGARSIALEMNGAFAYGHLCAEAGVHRFCRVSPFDKSGRVHTSFVGVEVVPFRDEPPPIALRDGDLRVTTSKSSGPGGQHGNTTDSRVTMVHLPTGVVVHCQRERSQLRNRVLARKMMLAKLYAQQRRELETAHAEHGQKTEATFGRQIRSYELHQGAYVKDHRSQWTCHRPDRLLEVGDFLPVMRSVLLS